MAWKHAQGLESLLLQWTAKVHTHTAHVYVCVLLLWRRPPFFYGTMTKSLSQAQVETGIVPTCVRQCYVSILFKKDELDFFG